MTIIVFLVLVACENPSSPSSSAPPFDDSASLGVLTVNAGGESRPIIPELNPRVSEYRTWVANGTTSATFAAATIQPDATLPFTGITGTAADGTTSLSITAVQTGINVSGLTTGENVITATVTSPDGSLTTTYTLTIDVLRIITGTAYDSVTRSRLSGATVTVAGDITYPTATTAQSTGSYSIQVPSGEQTLRFTNTGYFPFDLPVDASTSTANRAVMSTTISAGLRIVLSWARTPRDLDSNLLQPDRTRVYYGVRDVGGAVHNGDRTQGHGPETTTINTPQTGEYIFYVWRHSTDAQTIQSQARVDFYDSNGHVSTRMVPTTHTENHRAWRVATITSDGSGGFSFNYDDTFSSSRPSN
ncbi:MAG: cadherin-like beta sandwich domain-containing protein [Spirochaetales bacterium]|nr:cadherin-like beta sandwich domain-containing protein [Spirochaetales bacterium]